MSTSITSTSITAAELPPGWVLYADLDAASAAARGEPPDPGARREDRRAFVFYVKPGVDRGAHLRATVPRRAPSEPFGPERRFDAGELVAAARWCDERIAERDAADVQGGDVQRGGGTPCGPGYPHRTSYPPSAASSFGGPAVTK